MKQKFKPIKGQLWHKFEPDLYNCMRFQVYDQIWYKLKGQSYGQHLEQLRNPLKKVIRDETEV